MLVSIITVTLNSESFLRTCIESVLDQSYPFIEYIIVDGDSSDRTLAIAQEYASEIDFIISEPDGGVYDAMNKGIKAASGEIIGFLNSDDVYNHRFVVEEAVRELVKLPETKLVYSNLYYVDRLNLKRIRRTWKTKAYYPQYFEHGNVPPHPTLFIKKEVFDAVGVFNIRFTFAADYEFMLRVLRRHNLDAAYLNHYTVRMRLGGLTNRSIKNIWRGNIEIISAWRVNGLEFPILLLPMKTMKRLIQFF